MQSLRNTSERAVPSGRSNLSRDNNIRNAKSLSVGSSVAAEKSVLSLNVYGQSGQLALLYLRLTLY
jgi:hypothetical protein